MTYPPPPANWQYPPQPKEPRATTAMILGIIGVAGGLACYLPVFASPFALVLGKKSLNAIDREPHLGGRGEAMAGFVLGIIGSVLLALGFAVIAAFAIWFVSDPAGFDAFMTESD